MKHICFYKTRILNQIAFVLWKMKLPQENNDIMDRVGKCGLLMDH